MFLLKVFLLVLSWIKTTLNEKNFRCGNSLNGLVTQDNFLGKRDSGLKTGEVSRIKFSDLVRFQSRDDQTSAPLQVITTKHILFYAKQDWPRQLH